MKYLFVFCVFLTTCYSDNQTTINYGDGYYWRDFNGSIPADALRVVDQTDKTGRLSAYIGQVYIPTRGIFPGQIYAGVKDVKGVINGGESTPYSKILCGDPSHFEWIPTTSKKVFTDLVNHTAVLGGHQDQIGENPRSSGVLQIGRVLTKTKIIIGKVDTIDLQDGKLHYLQSDEEKLAESYDLLTIKK